MFFFFSYEFLEMEGGHVFIFFLLLLYISLCPFTCVIVFFFVTTDSIHAFSAITSFIQFLFLLPLWLDDAVLLISSSFFTLPLVVISFPLLPLHFAGLFLFYFHFLLLLLSTPSSLSKQLEWMKRKKKILVCFALLAHHVHLSLKDGLFLWSCLDHHHHLTQLIALQSYFFILSFFLFLVSCLILSFVCLRYSVCV